MRPAFAKAMADEGGLAQLARAPALHAGGHRFESDILHIPIGDGNWQKEVLKNIDVTPGHEVRNLTIINPLNPPSGEAG